MLVNSNNNKREREKESGPHKCIRLETPRYKDIWRQINIGDSHPLKHGATSKNVYASKFTSKHSGISDQLQLIEKVTQDQRDGKHALSEYVIHSIAMGSAEDNFAFRFVFKDKEEGMSKVVGFFTSQTGDVYNQKQAEIWFGIGFFGTATPSGNGYDKKHDLNHGTYEEICTRDHFMYESSKRKYTTEEQQKSFVDSNYQEFLETSTKMEKQTFDSWTQNHTYRETRQQMGQDPWWPTVERHKVTIESRGQDQTPYYIVSPPRGLCQGAKTSYQGNIGKHRKPKQRKTPQK